MAPTPEAVLAALSHVTEPDLRRSIVELGMVRDVRVDGGVVSLTVVLATPISRLAGDATERVTQALLPLDGVERVGVTSGASVPDALVQGVLDHLQANGFPAAVEERLTEENLTFALPPELRKDLKQRTGR